MMNQLLVVVEEVHRDMHPCLLCWISEFLSTHNFISSDKLFSNVLQRLVTFLSIDINLLDMFGKNLDGDDNNNSVTPITFLPQSLTYLTTNLTITRSHCNTLSFCTNTKENS